VKSITTTSHGILLYSLLPHVSHSTVYKSRADFLRKSPARLVFVLVTVFPVGWK
jgi:hypothetical protein